jgi:hypothetical protein
VLADAADEFAVGTGKRGGEEGGVGASLDASLQALLEGGTRLVLELEAAGLAEPLLDSLLQGRSSLAKSLRRSASPVDESGAGCDMARPSRSDDEQTLNINENVRLLLEDGAQLLARLEDEGLSEDLLETLIKGRSLLGQRLVMEAIKTSLPEAGRGTPQETDHKAQPDQVQPGDEPKKEEIAQRQTDARAVHPKEDTKELPKRAEITQEQTDAKGVHAMVHEVVHAKEHIKEHLDMVHQEPTHSESAPDAEKHETPKHSGQAVQAQEQPKEHPKERPKERTRDHGQVVQAEVEAGASPSQIAGTLPSATYSSSTQCKYSIVALYSTYTTELTLQNAGTLPSATSAAAPAPAPAAASEREREKEREVEGGEEEARAPPPKEHPKEHPKAEQNERATAIVAVPMPPPASVTEVQPERGVPEAVSVEEAVSAAERVEDAGARPTNTSQRPKERPKEHPAEVVKAAQARPTNVPQQPQEVGEALAPQSVHPKEHPHQQPKEHQEVWGQELWVELRYAEGARTFGLREEQRLADVIALVGGVRPQSVRVLVADTRVCNADLCDLLAVRYAQEST